MLFLKLCISLVILNTIGITPCQADEDGFHRSKFENHGVQSEIASHLQRRRHWGFIDKSGKFVIPPRFDIVEGFKNGSAVVRLNGNCFHVDRTGKALDQETPSIQFFSEIQNARWAKEALEKAEAGKKIFKGDICDVNGTSFVAHASQVKLEPFVDGLAMCKFPPELLVKIDSENTKSTDSNRFTIDKSAGPLASDRNLNAWGFINEQGHLVIPPRFYTANNFKDGIASVDSWNSKLQPNAQKSGFIKKDGTLIGNQYFECAWPFENGFGIVNRDKSGSASDEWGFIDADGKQIWGDYCWVHAFAEGLAAVQTRSGKWGYINTQGRIVIPANFEFVQEQFSDGIAFVRVDGLYGYIDTTGKFLIPPTFFDAGTFHEGLAAAAVSASLDEKNKILLANGDLHCGFINRFGHQAIAPKFTGARNFSEGLCAVQSGTKWGFINDRGDWILSPKYDNACPFSEGLAAAQIGDKWGFIDKSGKFIIAPTFPALDMHGELVRYPKRFSESFALLCGSDFDWRFVNRQGVEAFPMPCAGGPSNSEIAKLFSEGLAAVDDRDFGNCGYVDHKGVLRIPHQFQEASSFSESLAAVKFSPRPEKTMQVAAPFDFPSKDAKAIPAKFGYINHEGKFVIKPNFDLALPFKEGKAGFGFTLSPAEVRARKEKYIWDPGKDWPARWGFINPSGTVVIPAKFDQVGSFSLGRAAVKISEKWGFIDQTGKIICPPRFEDARSFSEGLAAVKINGKYGYIDRTGKLAIKPKYWQAGSFSNGRALIAIPGPTHHRATTDQIWLESEQPFLQSSQFDQRLHADRNGSWEGHP